LSNDPWQFQTPYDKIFSGFWEVPFCPMGGGFWISSGRKTSG
jgi:hypothetical protein